MLFKNNLCIILALVCAIWSLPNDHGWLTMDPPLVMPEPGSKVLQQTTNKHGVDGLVGDQSGIMRGSLAMRDPRVERSATNI